MRYMIYADPHWSSYSSIVRSRGNKYSTRLENLLNTINWIEHTANEQNCDAIICLGDFFDKCDLNSEELTALQEINWSYLRHYFITGNHEMGRGNLEFSSAHLFNLCPNTYTISGVSCISDDEHDTNIVFLPYILELNRKPLIEYLKPFKDKKNIIVMSHNDISGIQMGQYVSKDGFSIEEIENECTLFINGHLHNGTTVGQNIINLGNLTGQNFSEDAFKYKHKCMILDTGNHSVSYIDNPYAFNFYKLDFSNYQNDEQSRAEIVKTISSLDNNAIITVKCNQDTIDFVRDIINNTAFIIESRIILDLSNSDKISEESLLEDNLSINHITKFVDYIKSEVGTSELIIDELNQVVGMTV